MQMSAVMTLRAPLAARLRRSNAAGSRRGARSRCAMPPRAAADEPTQPIGLAAELTDTSRLGQRGELLCAPPSAATRQLHGPCSCARSSQPLAPYACAPRSVVAQFASLAGVFAPPPPLDALSGALGTAAALGGVAVALAGAQGLGASLSPFPAPMRGNVLVTDGIYAQTRNPMYAGLLLASFGVALASASPARALFTALLAAVLGAKMDTEEAALRVRFGWALMMSADCLMAPC
jgi:protein-S-isoprenylcysteine O-methyltransferase Ste14